MHYKFSDKLKKLGFSYILTAADYDGDWNDGNCMSFRIWKQDYTDEVKQKLIQLCNLFGYSITNVNENAYDGNKVVVTVETNYGKKFRNPNGNIDEPENAGRYYWHATPNKKLDKILSQGLVPKGGKDKLGLGGRQERIYLCPYNDERYFNNLFNSRNISYRYDKDNNFWERYTCCPR